MISTDSTLVSLVCICYRAYVALINKYAYCYQYYFMNQLLSCCINKKNIQQNKQSNDEKRREYNCGLYRVEMKSPSGELFQRNILKYSVRWRECSKVKSPSLRMVKLLGNRSAGFEIESPDETFSGDSVTGRRLFYRERILPVDTWITAHDQTTSHFSLIGSHVITDLNDLETFEPTETGNSFQSAREQQLRVKPSASERFTPPEALYKC